MLNNLFVTKKNAEKIAYQVVCKWEDKILEALDIPDVVFYIHQGFHFDTYIRGQFTAKFGPDINDPSKKEEYNHEMSYIDLYPMALLYLYFPRRIRIPITRKMFERRCLEVLAHELRHAYQYYYKVHLSKYSLYLPYHKRPEEKDAFSWSKQYVKEVM